MQTGLRVAILLIIAVWSFIQATFSIFVSQDTGVFTLSYTSACFLCLVLALVALLPTSSSLAHKLSNSTERIDWALEVCFWITVLMHGVGVPAAFLVGDLFKAPEDANLSWWLILGLFVIASAGLALLSTLVLLIESASRTSKDWKRTARICVGSFVFIFGANALLWGVVFLTLFMANLRAHS